MPDQILTILGLAVLDKIRFADGRVIKDVLGGSGTFCTLRMVSKHAKLTSARCCWRTVVRFWAEINVDIMVDSRWRGLSKRG